MRSPNGGPFLQHSQCVVYIDNEAARGALTNVATSTESGRQIIQDFVLKDEMGYQIKIWFARVPASSNLADKPSRLETSELDALGVARDAIDWQLVEAQLEDAGSDEWGFKYGILVPRAFPRFAVKKGVCGSFFREFEFFRSRLRTFSV